VGTGRSPNSRRLLPGPKRAVAEPVDKQSHHGLSVVGSVIVGAPAHACDRIQKIRGSEIGANLARSYCGVEKCLKGRLEALPEVGRQMVEGRIPRVQGGGQSAFGAEKGRVSLHPFRQCIAGSIFSRKDHRGIRAAIDFVAEDSCDKIGALWKVAIEGPDADSCLLDDLSHRRLHSGGRKDLNCRLEQRIDVPLRVDAHPPIPAAPRLHTIGVNVQLVLHSFPLTIGTVFHIFSKRNIVPV
jgi:hypothetical protein